MDVGAFVQENKRWLIGAAVGLVVWLIARAILGSIYNVDAATSAQVGLRRSIQGAAVYNRDALNLAREEQEQLASERQRLQEGLAFAPTARFLLAGNGDANQYLFQVGREVKQQILGAADERDVLVGDKELAWPVPTGVDEIRGVLFGLELLDETAKRLFAAHDARRATHPDAIGLRAIALLKVEERRAQRSSGTRRRGEVDLSDVVVQERVQFQLEGDEATFAAFLEACRVPGRTLAIESWQLQQGARRGDPCTLKGTLLGIAWKQAAAEGK